MPEYSTDVNDDFWRYTRLSTVEVLGNISIYIVSFDEKETIAAAYYREYDEVNNMISFGTVEYGAGAEFSITDSDGNTRTAQQRIIAVRLRSVKKIISATTIRKT